MSNQNWNSTTPDPAQDPSQAVPGYQPPQASGTAPEEYQAPSPEAYQSPEGQSPQSYAPPAGGFEPAAPGYPPAYGAPGAYPPVSYGTPAGAPYQQPASGYDASAAGHQAPDASGYQAPPAAAYGQPTDPYGQPAAPYGQPAAPYGQPAAPYGQQPPAPYGQPAAPYGQQPPAPYGQPAAPYGQPPAPYGQPTDPYAAAGYGVPNYPVPAGAPLADWGKRALGALIDYAPVSILSSIGGNLAAGGSTFGSIMNFVLWLAGIAWLVWNTGYKGGTTGVTLGRSIAKTKLIGEASGQPIGFGLAVVRYIAHIIDSLACFVGWFMPLWDAKRQTISDKLMKTVVLDVSADPNASRFEWK